MAADSYSTDPGDYGMPNTGNGGPTGIPDPQNPGFDTAGYPLPGRTAPPKATQGPNPPGATTPGVGQPAPPPASTNDGGTLVSPFTTAAPTLANVPVFTPPSYTPPPAFAAPSAADALRDPGYQFRTNEGERALEAAAASRGVLNSGGTLKDLVNYGQNAATQEYQNVYNRDVNTYNTNYQTQYRDPYAIQYQGALDAFSPKLAAFGAQNNLDFNTWLQQYQIFRNRQLDSVNANAATAG